MPSRCWRSCLPSWSRASTGRGQLGEIVIPKDTGGQRVLHIPAVRDRVVQRAVLAELTPLIDPLLGPSS
jgi:hypothetical protein